MFEKVSRFKAEREQEAQTPIKKENNTYNEFFWGLLSFFPLSFFSPQLTWEIWGKIYINQIEPEYYKFPHVLLRAILYTL